MSRYDLALNASEKTMLTRAEIKSLFQAIQRFPAHRPSTIAATATVPVSVQVDINTQSPVMPISKPGTAPGYQHTLVVLRLDHVQSGN